MCAFAVRLATDHQVVGIFVAETMEQLADIVDQCVDPAAAEYLRLGVGGVYVPTPTDAQWPARDVLAEDGEPVDIDPMDSDPLKGAHLDDFWWRDMNDGEWLPLVWDRDLPGKPSRRVSKDRRR